MSNTSFKNEALVETAPQAHQAEAKVQAENLSVVETRKKNLAVHAKLDSGMCLHVKSAW